jgi:hypothetical protein
MICFQQSMPRGVGAGIVDEMRVGEIVRVLVIVGVCVGVEENCGVVVGVRVLVDIPSAVGVTVPVGVFVFVGVAVTVEVSVGVCEIEGVLGNGACFCRGGSCPWRESQNAAVAQ